MLAGGFYGHFSPAGTSVLERVKASGYRPRIAGENLANGPETVDQVVSRRRRRLTGNGIQDHLGSVLWRAWRA
jgi:hypothetical protein